LFRLPVRGTNLSSSAEHSERFCGPPSLLVNAFFGSFLRLRAGCREADHSPPSRAEEIFLHRHFMELCLNKHEVAFVLTFSTLWVRGNCKIVFISIEYLTQIISRVTTNVCYFVMLLSHFSAPPNYLQACHLQRNAFI
jgi:hypothetical protein